MAVAELGGRHSHPLRMQQGSNATVVFQKVLGECLSELSRASREDDVQFKKAQNMQPMAHIKENVEELAVIQQKPDPVALMIESSTGKAALDKAQALKGSAAVEAGVISKMDSHAEGSGALRANKPIAKISRSTAPSQSLPTLSEVDKQLRQAAVCKEFITVAAYPDQGSGCGREVETADWISFLAKGKEQDDDEDDDDDDDDDEDYEEEEEDDDDNKVGAGDDEEDVEDEDDEGDDEEGDDEGEGEDDGEVEDNGEDDDGEEGEEEDVDGDGDENGDEQEEEDDEEGEEDLDDEDDEKAEGESDEDVEPPKKKRK